MSYNPEAQMKSWSPAFREHVRLERARALQRALADIEMARLDAEIARFNARPVSAADRYVAAGKG